MGKKAKRTSNKNVGDEIFTKVDEKSLPENKLVCVDCANIKHEREYYTSYDPVHKSGKIPYCKKCLKDRISNNNGSVSLDKVKKTLQLINRPYLHDLWISSLEKGKDSFGIYMKNLALQQNRTLTWGDSQFEPSGLMSLNYDTFFDASTDFEITKEVVEKWGAGYKLEEYEAFERKYENLKHHYLEKTSMHTEALLKYIRYSVKEELATASNEVVDAKAWGQLAKDAASAAKINPSQLSASDLQDGLSTFGQLVRTVEKSIDIIPILPQFKESPQDLPDFVMFCYINYIRDLKGLPLCEYKDIYDFYERRKAEYNDRFNNLGSLSDDEGVEDYE